MTCGGSFLGWRTSTEMSHHFMVILISRHKSRKKSPNSNCNLAIRRAEDSNECFMGFLEDSVACSVSSPYMQLTTNQTAQLFTRAEMRKYFSLHVRWQKHVIISKEKGFLVVSLFSPMKEAWVWGIRTNAEQIIYNYFEDVFCLYSNKGVSLVLGIPIFACHIHFHTGIEACFIQSGLGVWQRLHVTPCRKTWLSSLKC